MFESRYKSDMDWRYYSVDPVNDGTLKKYLNFENRIKTKQKSIAGGLQIFKSGNTVQA